MTHPGVSESSMKAVEIDHSADNEKVYQIKAIGSELISLLETIRDESNDPVAKRRAATAITYIETGVMWGVKANF